MLGAGFFLFLVLLILILPTLISTEFSESIVESQVNKRLPSTTVEIGDFQIGWTQTLSLDQLSVKIQDEEVLNIGNVSVPKTVFDLVNLRIVEWDEVIIDEVKKKDERNEDESFNFDPLLQDINKLGGADQQKGEKPSSPSPIDLANVKLNATSISLNYTDKKLGHEFELVLDEWLMDWPDHSLPLTTDVDGFIRVDGQRLLYDLRAKVENN